MLNQLRSLGINVREGQRGDVKTTCPKCSETRKNKHDKCLSVNVSEGVWNCHNCGYAGAIRKEPQKEYIKPSSELKTLSQPVIDWFAARGISNQTLLRYKISEGIDYMPQAEREVRTIHFNYYYNGEIQNIKFRDSAKNFKLVSGARLLPFAIDVASDNSSTAIVITEGEMDVLSFYEAGIKNAVSVPNGASKSSKLEWLDECFHMFEGKTIYLATDMDEPGIALRNELARRFGKENCYIIEFPYKDANEVLMNGGDLVACYNNAKPYPVEGIDDAISVKDQLLHLYEEGTPKGYDIGYNMDFIWHMGQVTLVTGIPGHGKSTWIKNVIYRLAKMHGLKSFVYSAEEANTAFALADMIQIDTGKSFFQGLNRVSKEDVENTIPFLNEHFKYYRLYDNDLSMEGILAKAKEMVQRHGVNIIVVDNMSTVEKSMSAEEKTRHHQIKIMMSDVARFARNYDVHVLLVAHPKKMAELKNGIYKVPNGYDVGDSSHWYNLPDNGISVYRNFETGQMEIHKWKVRFKYTGQMGTAYFSFNVNNSRYEPTERINNGEDKTKFIGQPYAKTFAQLAGTV